MQLNINDTFSTVNALQTATKQYILTLPFKFLQPVMQKKLYTINCIGKKDFHCDALIQAILRKKDNLWVIKKIKLQHKCPNEIHSIGSEAYIFKKVNEIQEIKKEVIRPGKLVKMLDERGCKIGYGGVYNAYKIMREIMEKENNAENNVENNSNNMDDNNAENNAENNVNNNAENNAENNGNNMDDNSNNNKKNSSKNEIHSNELNRKDDTKQTENDNVQNDKTNTICLNDLPDTFYDSFIYELKMLNKFNAKIVGESSFIFIQFNDLVNLTRRVIEIKVYEKLDGYVIYAILFDPHDFPIVYACIVTELDLKESFRIFFRELSTGFNIMVEFNKEIMEILEEMNIDYFVKVRDICKEMYKIEKDKGAIENVYGICNGIIKREGGYEKRDKKKKRKTEETKDSRCKDENKDSKEEKENIESNNNSVFQGNAFNNISSNLSALKGEANKYNVNNISNGAGSVSNYNSTNETNYSTSPYELDPFVYDKIIQSIKSLYNFTVERFIKEKNYFGLQNMHEVELDYINPGVYNLEMIECFNGILSMLQLSDEKEDIGNNVRIKIEKNKKIAKKECFEVNKNINEDDIKNDNSKNFRNENSKNIKSIEHENMTDNKHSSIKYCVKDGNKKYTVIPDIFYCSCGMFQSLLIPCVHACSFLENSFDFVSILYSKKYFLFDYNVTPVIEDVYKHEKGGKYVKMTGRCSKKKRVRKDNGKADASKKEVSE
ncbi:hypothetical protein BDAP_001568 [Binucleata daphniae]